MVAMAETAVKVVKVVKADVVIVATLAQMA
jgi:hypothetical protein